MVGVLLLAFPASAVHAAELSAPPPVNFEVPQRTLEPFVARTLETMEGLGVPDRFLDKLRSQAEVAEETDVYAFSASDLNGDGSPEVIEWEITYSMSFNAGSQSDPFGLDESFETKFTIRSGLDGDKLWRKRYDDLVFPVDVTGADGRRGIVTIGGLLSFFGSATQRYLDFESLKGTNGKRQWRRSYSAVAAGDFLTQIAENTPIGLSFTQTLPGQPADILLTLATEVSTLFVTTVAARTLVIDGKDGSETRHPSLDVGVNWYPSADAVGDLDGDGLRDYVVANNHGIDVGGPQEPPSIGGTLFARKGTDGSAIWTTSGLELYDFAWASGLPDMVGGKADEVALSTPKDGSWNQFVVYLFEGTDGIVRWRKDGFGPVVPGDVDRDGKPDVVLVDWEVDFEDHNVTFEARAFRGTGKRIYSRAYDWRFKGLPCPSGLCSGGYGIGWGGAGDVHPDGLRELFLYAQVQQDPGEAQSRAYITDGRDGSRIWLGEGDLYPAGDAIDGRGDDLLRVETKGGISTVEVLDGLTQRRLLRTVIQRRNGPLPRSAGAFVEAFRLAGDRCADLVVNMFSREGSFYAVLDGASAAPRWSFWNGSKAERPHFTIREDRNPAC